jgi:hypothetical protein
MSVRYLKDTSRLFDTDSFYELSYASWNGPNNNNALSFARGLRWTGAANTYGSADVGVGHINRTTGNLGTPFQFYFRFACGTKVGSVDLSLGFVHYSNGKFIFHWQGPNNGEDKRIALLDSDKLDIEREGLAGKRMICIECHA